MRILIKLGSSLISRGNRLNTDFLEVKAKEISELQKEGNEIIIVSSGAVACGMGIEKLRERPKDSLKLQLLSGEGHVNLMSTYKQLFDKEGILIAQVLLTHHNFDTEKERETIIHIIDAYLRQKTIPIINENDLISKEELESERLFTDNDILAALVAKNAKANIALILTDVEGLYEADPKIKKSCLIKEVNEINDKIKKMASKETGALGIGGMYSKVVAAEMMTKEKIDVIVANGNLKLRDILGNKVDRTLFKAK